MQCRFNQHSKSPFLSFLSNWFHLNILCKTLHIYNRSPVPVQSLTFSTRSSAVAEKPRDAAQRMKSDRTMLRPIQMYGVFMHFYYTLSWIRVWLLLTVNDTEQTFKVTKIFVNLCLMDYYGGFIIFIQKTVINKALQTHFIIIVVSGRPTPAAVNYSVRLWMERIKQRDRDIESGLTT